MTAHEDKQDCDQNGRTLRDCEEKAVVEAMRVVVSRVSELRWLTGIEIYENAPIERTG